MNIYQLALLVVASVVVITAVLSLLVPVIVLVIGMTWVWQQEGCWFDPRAPPS